MAKNVRVRIAPSPTGFAHVGTAYTALFNYAFAKSQGGKFIIRIEDSDLKRNISGAEEKIYEALTWLGISWDEGTIKGGKYGPYRLSDRLPIYQKKAEELVEKGMAFKDKGAIRFKNPEKDVSWDDLVRGDITFPGKEITDFVMLKSDGYPTYNFNVVVDDSMMKISHVIRGEDHISNTPRQIALYKAFGYEIPKFAHHPLLLNKDRKKLSKRDAAVDVFEYKKQGYLPEAFVNFLCLLGWSHPKEMEIFSLDEFVKLFSLNRVRKSGPIFDLTKLNWMSGEYIRRLTVDEFNAKLQMLDSKWEKVDKKALKSITPLVQERINRLSEFENLAGFFFKKPKVKKKDLGKNWKGHLKVAVKTLDDVDKWDRSKIDKELLAQVEKYKFKTGDFFMDLRIALTGNRVTPPINDSIVILGKAETIARLKKVLSN